MAKKKSEDEKKFILENMSRDELETIARALEDYEPLKMFRAVEEGARASDMQKSIISILHGGGE